ncbi:MAG: hypothetical protein AAF514_15305 [Verrucomicrobiota bacterium]
MSAEHPPSFDLGRAFSAEDFRKQGHAVVDQLADYLAAATQTENHLPVIPWESPEEATAYWDDVLKTPGTLGEDLLPLVLEKAFHVHHPHNLGHQVGTNLPMALLENTSAKILCKPCSINPFSQTVATAFVMIPFPQYPSPSQKPISPFNR